MKGATLKGVYELLQYLDGLDQLVILTRIANLQSIQHTLGYKHTSIPEPGSGPTIASWCHSPYPCSDDHHAHLQCK